jgi:hypothetical protein
MQERRSWLPVLAVALALAAAACVLPRADARPQREARFARLTSLERAGVTARVVQLRDEVWRWRRLMGRPVPSYAGSLTHSTSLGYAHWVLRLWARRADAARRQAQHPPHLSAWLCIHRGEASWGDPNPPYYGGLQMDYEFQQTYGRELLQRKGTADHWTPLEQMWVAERAFRSGRGFYPWPNTARYCGLL